MADFGSKNYCAATWAGNNIETNANHEIVWNSVVLKDNHDSYVK